MKRIDISREIERKVMHIMSGSIIVLLLYFDLIDAWFLFLMLILGGIISLISKKYDVPIISWFLKRMERKEQLKRLPGKGALSFLIGVLLAIKLFPKEVALASIVIMTFGDSLSLIYGSLVGKRRVFWNNNKNVEGLFFGGLIAGFLAAIFVNPFHAIISSFCAMLVESLEVKVNDEIVDDNILIPLVSGTIILLLRKYGVFVL